MPHPKSVVELLQDLIAIPSVNPSGDPGFHRTGEQEVAEYTVDFLRKCGAETELREVAPGRPNLIARFPVKHPQTRLAFAGHFDTVSVAGMNISPFHPDITDGRIFGRGSTDAKGPMAAALWALAEWARLYRDEESRVEWIFLGLMNEEAGGSGAHAVADSHFQSDLVLVLEPTDLKVITSQKGAIWFEVCTEGRACHGSTPELGRNAIREMATILQALDSKLIPLLSQDANPTEGHSTLNIGTIAGGAKINIVPDRCRIEIDCRFLPCRSLHEIRGMIEDVIREVIPDARVNVLRHAPPLSTSRSLPWVKLLGAEAHGFAVSPWSSDAGVLNSPHSPCVCIGPGQVAQAHTADEWMSIDDLEAGTAFFSNWINVAGISAGRDSEEHEGHR